MTIYEIYDGLEKNFTTNIHGERTSYNMDVIAYHPTMYFKRTLEFNKEFQAWQLDGKHFGFKQEEAIKNALMSIAKEISER